MNPRTLLYLSSINEKVKRADKHIDELRAAIREWGDTEPYVVVRYCDIETSSDVIAVNVKSDPPPVLSAIAGDIINNLRSALDIMTCGLYEARGHRANDQTYFPIAWSSDAYAKKLVGIEDRVGPTAMRLFRALQPYKGGDHYGLWLLHELTRRDKHRLLLQAGGAVPYVTVPLGVDDKVVTGVAMTYGMVFPLFDGAVLMTRGPDEMKVETEPLFHVAFNEPGLVEGEPLLETLTRLSDLVKRVLEPFWWAMQAETSAKV